MRISHAILPFAVLAAGSVAASAATPRFGVQGALAFPVNDLTDVANLGLQLGGNAAWDFRAGHGLMGRVDGAFYGSKNGHSTTSLGVGADYTYHVDGARTGVYFLAGISLMSYSSSYHSVSNSKNGLGFDLGIGYEWRRDWSLQARYTTHNIDHSTFGSFNLGAVYSF